MNSQMVDGLDLYLESTKEELLELLLTLCAIPAPSHKEEKRAAFCKSWLEKQGAQGVYVDNALNVVYPVGCVRCGEQRDLTVFMAHTDTVFPDLAPMAITVKEGKIFCPGVGDDTANLAVLLMLAKFVAQKGITPPGGVLFVANSCEEGLGNLKGCRQLMKDYEGRIGRVISLDGYYTGLVNDAVGSTRYQVEIKTEGGHSFGNFGNRNAIHYLSAMIGTLYTVKVPDKAPTTYNVGTISGGTSVNTIAQQAEMLYEYRSQDRDCLAFMDDFFQSVVESTRKSGVEVNVTCLGERPCSSPIAGDALAKLTQRAAQIIQEETGRAPKIQASSTDCNMPLSLGIPAICTGVCLGGGAHTREEWIETASLWPGYRMAARLLGDYLG